MMQELITLIFWVEETHKRIVYFYSAELAVAEAIARFRDGFHIELMRELVDIDEALKTMMESGQWTLANELKKQLGIE